MQINQQTEQNSGLKPAHKQLIIAEDKMKARFGLGMP